MDGHAERQTDRQAQKKKRTSYMRPFVTTNGAILINRLSGYKGLLTAQHLAIGHIGQSVSRVYYGSTDVPRRRGGGNDWKEHKTWARVGKEVR